MSSIHQIKRLETPDTPILLFDCELPNGTMERWSTHRVELSGNAYSARILRHNVLEMRAAADDGIDAFSKLTITLANADSYFSQIARNIGYKGAKVTVRFAFFNLATRQPVADPVVVFRGVCNPPDEITESTVRLTYTSRMNLQRILLPPVRIQRRCPWMFPGTAEQRIEAVDGGSKGEYSPFYRCGYSPDAPGGRGNLNGGQPYTGCDYTKTQCMQRGMFSKDQQNNNTLRFGGVGFLPSTTLVKTYGEKGSHSSSAVDNEAKYNDFVPLVYGTAWHRPPVVFAKNDGNLTHMELLLGMGEISKVIKVVVNGNDLPIGTSGGSKLTSTGWFGLVGTGPRQGSFNLDFRDGAGNPLGDPYGSMALLSVVVPNRISDGSSLPKVEVLMEGLKLQTYSADGEFSGKQFTNSPAWVLLDLLRRSGWQLDEIDLQSFANTAAYCAEPINTTDLNGNDKTVPRFQCNLVVRRRRSAADVIRGVRNSAGLFLTYGASGLLELHPEGSLAIQHPGKPVYSNATTPIAGGWAAYEFGDGTSGFTDIIRRDEKDSGIRIWSRSTAETPNRFTIEFQDEFNEYQQDSLSLVDLDDSVLSGQEVSASLLALGIPNFNQAGRILKLHLDRSLRGNVYIDFETGLRGIGVKPGDLITLTYMKDGFDRQLFRVLRVAPGLNFNTIALTAQLHSDDWYTGNGESLGVIGGGRQQGSEHGIPRPLTGTVVDDNGATAFEVTEKAVESADGSYEVDLTVEFVKPAVPGASSPSVPLVSLAAGVQTSGGSLPGGRSYYYGLTAVAEDGSESPLSFLVRASVPSGSDTNAVTLASLSFAPATAGFNVYRGTNPLQLLRIAERQSPALTYTDVGAEASLAAPPDSNYHHANFYWRMELLPETQADIYSTSTLGKSTLTLLANEYRGKVVRIVAGKGVGQERLVLSNNATTLTVVGEWETAPDATSEFAVAESTWNFAALTEGSPVVFRVPNRHHATIQISGRSANAHDKECAAELSPLTRYTVGGAAGDNDVPPAPLFALRGLGKGLLEVSAIGFETLENTSTISAAGLNLHYVDELGADSVRLLATAVDQEETTLSFQAAVDFEIGARIQLEGEIVIVEELSPGGTSVVVERGACNSVANSHDAGVACRQLARKSFVLPFPRNFFGSPASGTYTNTLTVPAIRVAAAEMSMTNVRGVSQVTWISYAALPDAGIRTFSGGQLTLQVSGALATQSDAAPVVTLESAYSVRDIFAEVTEPSLGSPVVVRLTADGQPWTVMTIAAGQTISNVIDGLECGALQSGTRLGLDVLATGATMPGAGLTVSVRF